MAKGEIMHIIYSNFGLLKGRQPTIKLAKIAPKSCTLPMKSESFNRRCHIKVQDASYRLEIVENTVLLNPTVISNSPFINVNKRWVRLSIGLIFNAIGIVFTINANMGLGPWNALHMGLSYLTGISFGRIIIIVGLFLLLLTYQMDKSIGFGTLACTFGLGISVDFILNLNLIFVSHHILLGIPMLLFGMELIAIGSYFYIGSAFGTGPRDGLMVALTKATNRPVGLIRSLIEVSVLIVGALLGAQIGLGTLIVGFGIGPIVQMTFRKLNFDVTTVTHEVLLNKSKPLAPPIRHRN